jgi:hypothetical protein
MNSAPAGGRYLRSTGLPSLLAPLRRGAPSQSLAVTPYAVGRHPRATVLRACALCFLLAGQLAAAQVGSTVRGTAANDAGAALPGARISIKSLRTNETRVALTDRGGFFAVANLSPAAYQLTASAPGFSGVVATIAVSIGLDTVVRFTLRPGSEREHTSTVAVQTVASGLGGVVSSKTVRDLPTNGRDWTQGATLQAGVASVRTQPDATNTNSGRGQRGFGAQISVSGGRPQQNNYLLDGISINDYANAAPGSVLGGDLGADAVEEFSVVTSNYPAAYGRSSGGIINAVTRSGSNALHGTIYEFLRNSALDARNFFDKQKPPFRRNQFGASLGGPIQTDRTYFFANYEGLRQSLGLTHVDTVPSLAARSGRLSTGLLAVDPVIARYLQFYPLPNGQILAPGDTGIFTFSGQQITTENYFTTRLDRKFAASDSLSGTYVFDNSHTVQPDELDTKLTGNQSRRQLVTLQETHRFTPQALNTLRLGFNRVVALIGQTPGAISPLATDTTLGFLPGHTAGGISVLDLTDFGGGLGATSVFDFHWNSIQAYDDFALTRNNHSLRFGFSLERMRDNMLAASNPNGVFSFHSLSDFLQNRPFSLDITLPGTLSPRNLRQTMLSGYAQDDLRWTRNLTLNLGVRYEMATVPTEAHGKLSTLRRLTDAAPHLGDPYFANPTLRDFEPRLGLAWDPWGNGKVLVRGGFGIFDVLPLPYEFELLSLFAAPYFELGTPTNLPPQSFPAQAVAIAETNRNTLRNVFIQPDPSRNYVLQWNLNVGFQPAGNWTALVGYVGSRGVHQPFRVDDTNIILPQLTSAGYLWPTPPGAGPKLNPNVGRLDGLWWKGDSYYDALQLQLKKAMGRGLQAQVSYTFAKSLDTGSATIAGDQFGNSISSLPWFNFRLNRGLSDFDTAHNLSVHFTWDVPAPVVAGKAGVLVGGWQLGANFQASTGSPFTVVMGGDPLGLNSTDPYDVPNRIVGGGCNNPVNSGNPADYIRLQCFTFPLPSTLRGNAGRNSLIGPGLSNLDMSLFKNTSLKRFSDRLVAQFRVEVFNAFNHTNFAPPLDHRSIFDAQGNPVPGAGLIDSTATPSRQIQFGLKFIW